MSGGLSLPIISIDPYINRDDSSPSNIADRQRTSKALHEACRDVGFFYLDVSSFVDLESEGGEGKELMRLARAFFALEQEEKDKISIRNQDNARGYQRLKENVTGGKADNHEAIDFYAPVENPDKTKLLWGENQWPDDSVVHGFKKAYEAWIEKMKRLGMIMMEAMVIGLGATDDEWQELRGVVDNSFWVMRMIGYPPLPNDYDGFSCGAHKDYGCLTFLYADPTPNALQVFMPDTGSGTALPSLTDGLPKEEGAENGTWIAADPKPGCIVCNIGEMWEIWTAGLYRSTLHRVIHRSSNYRVSIPFFFEANFDALVKPLPAISRLPETDQKRVSTDAKYAPIVYGDFLKNKVSSNFSKETPGKGRY